MSRTSFEAYRDSFLEHVAASSNVSPKEYATVAEIFSKTHDFLNRGSFTSSNVTPGQESLENIPKLIVSEKAAFENLGIDTLHDFLTSCKVPTDAIPTCAMEVARILSGAHNRAIDFVDVGRQARKERIPLHGIYSTQSIAMIKQDARQSVESFGETSDRVTSDSRLAVALTVLRAHRSLTDRLFPREASEDPVVLVKIPYGEVYNLAQSQNPNPAIRQNASRQPLITLYRNPTLVNTTPQQIIPLLVNDAATPPGLLADNIIAAGQRVDLLSLTLQNNVVGYTAGDWTDLVGDGGAVDSIRVQVDSVSGGVTTTEYFVFSTRYFRQAFFTTLTNVADSGDRAANIRAKFILTQGSLTAAGVASTIFNSFANVNVVLDTTFSATLNIKNTSTAGSGTLTPKMSTTLPGGVPGAVNTAYSHLTFKIIGWTPYLFWSEENLRKTTAAVRTNYKEIEFLIPPGRNYIVDYSIMGQELPDEVTHITSETINIGNADRTVTILNDVLNSVYNRLQYELANPDIDYYTSVAQDYIAGTLSLPHVNVFNLDVTASLVMRSAEQLSDLHSFVTARLLAAIADGHNKSMYPVNLEPGEKPRYRVLTSGPIGEILIGIPQYWNNLIDIAPAVAENADYSLNLPNGTRIDLVKTNFEALANKMIVFPIREAKPTDVTSFGKILDRGTFVGQYTPVQNGAANKRIVANSREILFPTNPLGYVITVQNLQTVLGLLTDGPGLNA